ncbi:MAG: PRC-barrel domain-containing protein [Spirochaetia bacterium]
MLRSVKNLHNQCITSSGKPLGRVTSFFVRRDTREVSYVVVAPPVENGRTVEGRVVPVGKGFQIDEGPEGVRIQYAVRKLPAKSRFNFFPDQFISTQDFLGMSVLTPKGMIGEVEDLVIEDDSFELRFIIVDSAQIFSEKNLLVNADSIERIDPAGKAVVLSETIDDIR